MHMACRWLSFFGARQSARHDRKHQHDIGEGRKPTTVQKGGGVECRSCLISWCGIGPRSFTLLLLAHVLFGKPIFFSNSPKALIYVNQGFYARLDPVDLLIIKLLDLAVFYLVPALENPHRLRKSPAAVRIKRIDAVIVLVSEFCLLGQAPCRFQDLVSATNWRFLHLCQTLHEINPRARGIQREKDDDCRLLVRQGEPGNHVNQEAFSICPGIIQLPQQEQDVLELMHRRLAPDRRLDEDGRPARLRQHPFPFARNRARPLPFDCGRRAWL